MEDDIQPPKGELLMTLAHGVELRALTKACECYVRENLREGDRTEAEIVQRAGARAQDAFTVAACSVWHEDKLVAMWKSALLMGDGILSTRRAWGFLTTHNVDPIWRTFVRMTRPVYEAFWQLESEWVDTVYIAPWAGYEKTLRWQARCLPQTEVKRFNIDGEEHILYMIKRGGSN
jgi:hypothetical protein